ncbi:MAG: Serine/threonine-protein kinase Pkn1 [Chlamydiia bacterium]|nr:Serine/threonine-protein kinase Pkn1 [Chlamydiia bacterium]MCH9615557.1 Serine/threonine-protein kinase Pkn1 [Chlamydiia bacterium]MCH9629212.1 Serine/threonine-protein kinase Pkn1 [Chlamydiia bacterium]
MLDKIFGDYTITRKLGDGTLGSVYLAEHRFIKKQFVLKILPEDLAKDAGFVERFEKEVGALAALDHPNIVKVHNVSFADGKYYLVCDYVGSGSGESVNLSAFSKKTLSENQVYSILEQVASALDYAHQKKVGGFLLAHRSLKLNNILIGRDRVYLTDFGLARLIGEGEILTKMYANLAQSLKIDVPNAGYFLGHYDQKQLSQLHSSFMQGYAFLAPEQKVFRDHAIGTQVDTYAFGILAYFLLMRTFPDGCFSMPSEGRPDLKLNWDPLIKACLQSAPTKRPNSLPQALESVRAEPVRAIPRALPPEPTPVPPPEPSFARFEKSLEPDREMPSVRLYTENPKQTAVTQDATKTMIKQVSSMVRQAPKPVLKPQEIERPTYDPDPAAVFRVDPTVKTFKPELQEVHDVQPLLTDMIVVPGGEHVRGSDEGARDERPKHKVRLSDFAIDIHPVTNEQFVRFLDAMGGEKESNNQDIIRLSDSRIKRIGGKLVVESGYSKHPVTAVTWYGASAYAKWIGKRLPTEAEFEVASLGGMIDVTYPTGNEIDNSEANYFNSDTSDVMSYPPNGYGLYDMVGNVYEWCSDWYNYDYYEVSNQEPENPQGPHQGVYRVLRGGCWKSLTEDLRCSHRHRNNPATVNSTYGFRCSADVED